MSRILVTGGAGFIGSNLALELEGRGHQVVVVDNFRSGARANLTGFRGEVREGDVTQDKTDLEGYWDYVFHHGDITDPRHASPIEIVEKNLTGFSRVLELCQKARARLIYASTAGLYGNGPTPMREDQPKELTTAYARSKWQMDELGDRHRNEVPIVGLRYFNVFGPREEHKGRAASMIYHLAQQLKRGESPRLFRFGEHRRDFIYVKDVVTANLRAMETPSGVYNVGTGIASSFNEVAEAVGSALGIHRPIEYIEMPFDPLTYQNNTQADTAGAREKMGFVAEWGLWRAVEDYVHEMD